MAGRKPLPTHLKLVKGTARPHRLNASEPVPQVLAPAAPDHLEDRAKVKFGRLAQLLASNGIMTELDSDALARYCVVWCRWFDAEQEVRNRGPVVKNPSRQRDSKSVFGHSEPLPWPDGSNRERIRHDTVEPVAD